MQLMRLRGEVKERVVGIPETDPQRATVNCLAKVLK